ncbi:MAG TPA: type II secretion system major pseudopilin GspG [Steroidobacteraceae bacterium]|nr:type II secretion system major pseudopilin GspG [Steroidobacteraceae bacterium]
MADEAPTAAGRMGPDAAAKNNEMQSPAVQAAIGRAKQEWECTVDALPQLVCVIDGSRNIVRTNRAVETWALGKVREVQGRDLHELLHPACPGSNCALLGRLDQSWSSLVANSTANFEMHDPILGRYLNVTLRPMSGGSADEARAASNLVVIVLSDITELNNIQATLEAMNDDLESRIEARTRELNASRDELSMLSARLMTTQESERKRIAQELHDSIGQSLSAIKYSLERAVEMTLGRDPGAPRHILMTTISRVQETVESIRSIAMNLRPSMLDDLGAVSAVRWFCREFGEIYSSLRVHTDLAVTDKGVPEHLVTPIFRTLQESLNNVARHAQAKNVFVSMRGDHSTLTLEVRDDGVGFDPKETSMTIKGGHGLSGLRERAAKTGGTLSLQSKRRGGTVVRVGWPLAATTPTVEIAKRGFTLLELLVVMVIIGLLAGFVAPRYFAQVGKSQVKAARAQIDALDKALDQYRVDVGRFPTTEEGLEGLMTPPAGEPAWGGPYLKKAVPLDPWGHAYVYTSPGTHNDVDILSFGKDGQPGGSGENADITNW